MRNEGECFEVGDPEKSPVDASPRDDMQQQRLHHRHRHLQPQHDLTTDVRDVETLSHLKMGENASTAISRFGIKMNPRRQSLVAFVAFLFGLSSVFWGAHVARMVSTNGSDCASTFGIYRGNRYSNPGVTVGPGKCLLESKWMRVAQHAVRIPGGINQNEAIIDDWLWIDYHDRINVLVEAPVAASSDAAAVQRQFLVLKQTKYALEGSISLAVVGGIVEPGEEPERAARREVNEELGGLTCVDFISLGRFRTDVNRGLGWVNSFVALRCSRDVVGKGEGPAVEVVEEVGATDAERQDVVVMSVPELREAALMGRFMEVQWSNTVSLALLHPILMPP